MVPLECSDVHDAPRRSAGSAHKVAWDPREEVGSSIAIMFSGASTYAGAPGAGAPVVGNRFVLNPAPHRRGMSGSERYRRERRAPDPGGPHATRPPGPLSLMLAACSTAASTEHQG